EGKLKGEVRAADLLVVGPQAVVHATVRADKLVVLGEVRGEVQGAARVEVCAGGKLYGDVETQSLVIQEGATFGGRSRVRGTAEVAGAAGAAAGPPSKASSGEH